MIEEYKRQYRWRPWQTVYEMLPDLENKTVLDMGCGIGDQAADFIERGARVIGVDLNEHLLAEARSRCPVNARFIHADFRELRGLNRRVDGIWSSFSAAYAPDFEPVLDLWKQQLAKGGWIAVIEVDDLFGHKPLSENVSHILERYAVEAYNRGYYDFYKGRKLEKNMREAGFEILESITLKDQELSFSGPASPAVLESWRKRLERLSLLRERCGDDFGNVKEEFLACLSDINHESFCKVYCCIGRKRQAP